jgi:DNA-binding CsgD family transcriptional regulator
MQHGLLLDPTPVSSNQAVTVGDLDEPLQDAIEPALEPWGALDRRARLIVRPDGRVINSDYLARSLLQRKAGLLMRGDRLAAAEHRLQPALDQHLQAPVGSRRCLLLPAGGAGNLLLHSIRFVSASGDAVALSARLIGDDFTAEYKGLAEAFDLTSAEELVAQELLRGLTPAEISESHKLSIHTIRTHIAHVHAKLGVSSREGMWRRCGAFQVG